MSMVGEMHDCRICPCMSFAFAPASTPRGSQAAPVHELEATARAAGLMIRVKILLSASACRPSPTGTPGSCGSADFTTRYFLFARLARTATVSFFRWLRRAITSEAAPMLDRDFEYFALRL